MYVTEEPIRRPIPHEQPGPSGQNEWMEFRRLSASRLRAARQAKAGEQREEAAEMMRALGPKFWKALRDEDRDERDRIVSQLEDLQYHISNFDISVLLKEGIVAWSYGRDTSTDEEVAEATVPDDPTEVLDERTAIWAAKEIIAITRPPSDEEIEEDFLSPSSTGSTEGQT